ncbi:MAG: alpha/beta fold hydrolase [Pseudomonadales bacterium]|nr:alpha/beta fold hydrolase [Pseudomonadales bacterium]
MRINLGNGEACYGIGSGHPKDGADAIVFIHGAGFDHSVWVMPARYFARHGYRVIAPDLPAHGGSEGPALSSIEEMADWVAELIGELVPSEVKTTLVGHSLGSLVTLAAADRHVDLIDQVCLLGTSAPMPVGPPLLNAAKDNHHAAFEMANTWSHSTVGRIGASQNPGLSNFNSGERWLERMGEDTYHADLAACNAYERDSRELAQRSLVIVGSDDKMTAAKSGLKVASVVGSEHTVMLEGSGHAMLSEQPNQVLDALSNFVGV